MLPTILSIGPISISSYGLFLFLAFVSFTFFVWRALRDHGTPDELIFDNVIVVSVISLIGARVEFVATHWNVFQKSLLWTLMVWRYPGFSLWGGFFLAVATIFIYSRMQKLSVVTVLDSYSYAIPAVMIFVSIALLLDGTLVGKLTKLPWGMPAVGQVGKRHPVALYGTIIGVLAFIFLQLLHVKYRKRLPPSVPFWMVLSILGFTQLLLANLRSDSLYFGGLSVDQFIGTVLFIGPMVPLFKLLHGKRFIAKITAKFKRKDRLEFPI